MSEPLIENTVDDDLILVKSVDTGKTLIPAAVAGEISLRFQSVRAHLQEAIDYLQEMERAFFGA